MNISTLLRKEIHQSKLPIRRIAREAKVPYLMLYRWAKGITSSLPMEIGSTVFRYLTGKGFGEK